ncbi:MAG: hypothetical protein K2N72_13195 [Oscillospiraceae bacterium]|nr:hypothetical protein [Oscillospiraceae bacterium]
MKRLPIAARGFLPDVRLLGYEENAYCRLKGLKKMTYTYVIVKDPTNEDFKALCKRIGELYPGYEQKGGKKYADGAENARWEKGEFAITAELEATPAVLTVTSDEELPELEREYRLKEKERRKHERRERRLFYNTFMGSSARVKFLLIPGIIFVWFAVNLITVFGDWYSDPTDFVIDYFFTVVGIVSNFWTFLGWLWLLPAGAAVIWAARFKNPVIIKLLTAALPVLSVVYGCMRFGMRVAEIFFGSLFIGYASLPVMYMAVLPYLVIDEIACRRLLKLTGERPSKTMSVICWVLSFAASAAVLASFSIVENRLYYG